MADAPPPDTPFVAADEYTGQKLGKYELACRLSTGGMSEIFLACQRGVAGFRKYVVLKKILSNIRSEDEFVRMFVQEAKITALFTHPNIAQVFDLDVAEGELFLAMEFVDGATLVEIVQACIGAGEPIPTGFSLAVARDTALALHYAHTFIDPAGRVHPVVHRDVAEKNIMVSYDGATKLLDFGIVKRLDRLDLTQIGTVKGTTGYMSPEQIRGEKLDPRSDVFSLGVVLHECLVGHRLFYRKNRDDEMVAALTQDIPAPSRKNKEVTPELDAVVVKALAKDREDRYASARELARAIERASGELLWESEQCGELVQRFFARRREQTRRLLAGPPPAADEQSEVRLAARLSAPPPTPPTRSERTPVTQLGRDGDGADDVTRTLPPPRVVREGVSTRSMPHAPGPQQAVLAETLPEEVSYSALEEGPAEEVETTAAAEDPRGTQRGPVTAPESPATVLIDDLEALALAEEAAQAQAQAESQAEAEADPEEAEGAAEAEDPRPRRHATDPGEEIRTAFDIKRAGSPTVAVAIGVGVGLTVVGLVYLLAW